MEAVNMSLNTSADSLTTPRLTLSELDDIIKVRTHVICSGLYFQQVATAAQGHRIIINSDLSSEQAL